MQEIFDFLELLWKLRILILAFIVIVIGFLAYDKVIGVVDHHNNVFKKRGKNND